MIQEKLVSVQVPVYNGMPYLKRAIDSLLRQKYTNWECIIVNDGSFDGTKEYLDTLSDKRFRVLHLEVNRGRPYARQIALDNSKGEYVSMLDADDFYHPNKLLHQVNFLNNNKNIDLVSSQMFSFGEHKNYYIVRPSNANCGKEYIYNQGEKLYVAHGPSMFRKNIVNGRKFNLQLKLGQDIDFLKRIIKNKKYYILPEIHYYYSELDSVVFDKIMQSYNLKLKLKNKISYNQIINLYLKKIGLKLSYALFGIDFILKYRGRAATQAEVKEFKNYYK